MPGTEEVTEQEMLNEIAGGAPSLPGASPTPPRPSPPVGGAAQPSPTAPAPAPAVDPAEQTKRKIQRQMDLARNQARELAQENANLKAQIEAARAAAPRATPPPALGISEKARAQLKAIEEDLGLDAGKLQGVFESVVASGADAGSQTLLPPQNPPPGQTVPPEIASELAAIKMEMFNLRMQTDGPNRDATDLLRIEESLQDYPELIAKGLTAESILDEVHMAQEAATQANLPAVLAYAPEYRVANINMALGRHAAAVRAAQAAQGAGAPISPLVAPGRTGGTTNSSAGAGAGPPSGQEAEALRSIGQEDLSDAALGGASYVVFDP